MNLSDPATAQNLIAKMAREHAEVSAKLAAIRAVIADKELMWSDDALFKIAEILDGVAA